MAEGGPDDDLRIRPPARKPRAAKGKGKPRAGGPASGIPARDYKWEPFKPGNEVALKHGAGGGGGHQVQNLSRQGEEIAREIARRMLGHGDCPPQLLMPQFLPQVQAWSRHEAKAKLLHDWLEMMDVEDQVTPRKAGGESPVSTWLAAERGAERARDKLGLTPSSWAKIQKDLGIARRAEEDAVARLGAQGAQIRQRRTVIVTPEGDQD